MLRTSILMSAMHSMALAWTCIQLNQTAYQSWRIDIAGVLSCTMNDLTKDCLVVPTQLECQEKFLNDNTRPIKSCGASEIKDPTTICGIAYIQLTKPTTPSPSQLSTTNNVLVTDPPNKLTNEWRCFKTTSNETVIVRLTDRLQTECLSKNSNSCVSFNDYQSCRMSLAQVPMDTTAGPLSCSQLKRNEFPEWCVPTSITTPPPVTSQGLSTTMIAIIGLSVGVVVCVCVLLRFLYLSSKKKKSNANSSNPSFAWSSQPTSRIFGKAAAPATLSADHVNLGNLIHWRLDETQLQTITRLHTSSTGLISLGRYLGQVVVVKQPLESDRTFDIMQAFVEEVELMIRVQSPHVVKVIGVSYMRLRDLSLVLEYLERGDLQTYLATTRTTPSMFPWPEKIVVLQDVLKGLMHLHALGVIHRDIKARNVLLSHDMQAKLTDFGIARRLSSTTMTQGIGSLQWTAPEVLEGGQYTSKADIYSVGVLLSELDTHQPPYACDEDALSDIILMRPSQEDSRRVAIGFSTSCPHRIHKIAQQCLAMEPELRPSAAQLLQMLLN